MSCDRIRPHLDLLQGGPGTALHRRQRAVIPRKMLEHTHPGILISSEASGLGLIPGHLVRCARVRSRNQIMEISAGSQ